MYIYIYMYIVPIMQENNMVVYDILIVLLEIVK